MSLSDRRSLLAGMLATGALAGCGFSPAYAPGGNGDRLRDQIQPRTPSDEDDFRFADQIERRIGGSAASRYQLNYSIDTDTDGLAITSDQETLRYHLTGTVKYELQDRTTGQVVTQGQVKNFTAYSAIGTTVATRASQTDAARRLMVILADQTVTQLLASSGTWLP
ncbi:LPS-assembly lipoprotein [Aliiruegeria haliotis]|uniref:LPS-assembly lipoprotein n=1 Tax=Aliiruegeria haliotis TaxID=1280846 RepID=A0A2T0RSY7_9RHOB|nr:LPS assembly lipoprotein LptE [Aliiruegeria haliotis]PRY24220.1 LPS-assembly lipoprotein [Aliiruegeria haliotis]